MTLSPQILSQAAQQIVAQAAQTSAAQPTERKPELKSYSFQLTPGVPGIKYAVRGNFIYIYDADADFELSMDGSNYVPIEKGTQYNLADEMNEIFLRANSLSPSNGILIAGRGDGYSHYSYGGGGGDGGINMTTPIIQMPYGSPDQLGAETTASKPTSVIAIIIAGDPPSSSIWQLRVWPGAAAPVTDFDEGIIAPADYSTTNKRAWFRT